MVVIINLCDHVFCDYFLPYIVTVNVRTIRINQLQSRKTSRSTKTNAVRMWTATLPAWFITLPLSEAKKLQCHEFWGVVPSVKKTTSPRARPSENIMSKKKPPSCVYPSLWQGWDFKPLTLILLMWRIWWAPNNASKWQTGFNSAFKRSMEMMCVGPQPTRIT
jgi:hypothetical protein